MRADELIRTLLNEAVDMDRGLVAVELEMLIRNDLGVEKRMVHLGTPTTPGAVPRWMWDDVYADELTTMAAMSGFKTVPDPSVKPRPGETFETFYQDCEVNSIKPGVWSSIAPGLSKLLGWLKREDEVKIKRAPGAKIVAPDKVPPGKEDSYRTMRLPRARIPANASAGCHLHFDVDTWFGDYKHAQRFVSTWNAFQADIPQHLPVSRYHDVTKKTRGHRYAKIDPIKPLSPPVMKFVQHARDYFDLTGNAERYYALNTTVALDRGDIEFRFIHGTLNFAVIEGWMRTLAELIEFSRLYQSKFPASPTQVRSEFDQYLATQAPETDKFLAASRKRHVKSRDPLTIQGAEPPRATRRLFKPPPWLAKPKPKAPAPASAPVPAPVDLLDIEPEK